MGTIMSVMLIWSAFKSIWAWAAQCILYFTISIAVAAPVFAQTSSTPLEAKAVFDSASSTTIALRERSRSLADLYQISMRSPETVQSILETRSEAALETRLARSFVSLRASQEEAALDALDGAEIAFAGDEIGLAHIAMQRGRVEAALGHPEKAVSDFLNARAVFEQTTAEHYVSSLHRAVLVNLGNVYGQAEDLEAALESYSAAQALLDESTSPVESARLLSNKANIYLQQGEPAAARSDYLIALDEVRDVGEAYGEAFILSNLSLAELKLRNYLAARDYAEQAQESAAELGVAPLELASSLSLADAHIALGEFEAARQILERDGMLEGLDEARAAEVNMLLSYVHAARGDGELARAYRLRSDEAQSAARQVAINAEIANLREKFAAEQREQQILALQTVADLNTVQLRQQRYSIIASLATILALAFLVLLILHNRRAESRRRLVEGRLLERQRVAGELHDTLLQDFFGVSYLLASIARSEDIPSTARADIERVLDMTDSALTDTRRAVAALRDETPSPSLADTLRAVVDQAAQSPLSDARIDLRIEADLPPVSDPVRNACASIAREALTNAIKHADASRIGVRVWRQGGGLSLSIQDDGGGHSLDASQPGHWGLDMMRERARQAGGRLNFESCPGEGFSVTVTYDAFD